MNNFRRHILCNALVLAIGIGGAVSNVQAQVAADRKSFDVPAQPASAALNAFAEQADITLVFSQDLVAGITTRPLEGSYTTADGLQAMLEGTGLTIQRINDSTISIGDGTPAPGTDQVTAQRRAGSTTLDTITVTGTRIRGGETPSPVITIGTEKIREEGFTDLGEVIRSIPQNFSGGQNPEVGSGNLSGAGNANWNLTGGSGLNLRGLGPDATLTLLNGKRMSYGGTQQAVDISAIPVEAVERIEIVADGASAIYGSDAVGGVGNVILKRDFEGVTIGTRYGSATDGGLTTREYNVTAGANWSSGGLIATAKDTSIDPIYASQRNYADYLIAPTTIYPGSDLRSALVSVHQSLGDYVEIRLDALRTKRDQLYYYNYRGTNSFSPETTTTLVSPTIEFSLPRDWTLSLGGSWGEDEHNERSTTENATTGNITVGDQCYCNEGRAYELGAEGPLFSLAGGDARLAVGAGYRTNEYVRRNYITDTTTISGDQSAKFAYAEINLPVIGPSQNVPGVHRLTLTAAARGEDYDTFGSVITPKLGLLYSPRNDFTLKASWGRSFKAPTLSQQNLAQYGYLDPPGYWGGTGYSADATVLNLDGGNPDLDPERARTWSTSLAFHPAAWPGLEAELTYFDIEYTDRVVQPITSYSQAMSNPNYAQFIDYSPTAEEQARIISSVYQFYNFSGASYDPDNVVAIVYTNFTNVARQRVKGIDLSGAYRFDLAGGQLTIRGSASWLDSTRQISSALSAYDLAGTLFNPAKVNSRIGAVWSQGGFSVSTFANYTGSVKDTVNNEEGASFTTINATLHYATSQPEGVWSGLVFSLSAQNLFDRAPPLYTPVMAMYAAPYDGTNYSAIGRFLSLSVSKHF
ncbi:TonB-dependent receptor [Luteimonas sp. XNQY3]|nr:TonB-dependent receptor [Luteimonas sp. XNQY3]MCD9007041.1 TonB-dependent receptor [Luteimonas sp. XNQY3]